jgi:hypothetical protein
MHHRLIRWQLCPTALVMAMVVSLAAAQTTPPPAKPPPAAGTAPPSAAPAGAPASKEQLEQLLAPIALYPDSLLSQVLMAATYPADVAEAAKWVKAHPDNKGDSAVKAVQDQPWDPSVQSLAAFPQILDMMGAQPDWVQKLGDAFLASSKDVLDAVQRLRQKAQQAGNLKSNEQQKVVVEQEPTTQQTVIKVEPAQPETIYVPAYNPTVVYGTWPYPSYPPYYYPPPPYYYPGGALASGIAFGIGVAAVGAIWGGCNWGRGDVNINVNKYNTVNSNRQLNANQTNFQHNAANRKGVPYADQKSRDQFGSKGVGDASQRADYRGKDPSRDAQRQQAQSSLQDRGMDPSQGRNDLRNDPGARDRANQASQGAGDRGGAGGQDRGGAGGGFDSAGARDRASGASDNAVRGAGNAGQSRQQADRGSASRASASNFGGSSGGARASGGGGGGGRSGGGGGRGGGGRR